MVETDARTGEPVNAMSRFLQGGTPPTSPGDKGSVSPKGGSGGRSSPSKSSPKSSPVKRSGGFEVRKPLFKKVKIETFAEATIKADQDPVEGGGPEQVAPVVHEEMPIKKEDLDDLSWDDISAPCPDATTLSLLGPSSTTSATRRSMRTVWRGLDNQPCHVEQLCLQHYALQGFKGFHCEGKLLTMIFVLAMWDVIFQDGIAGSFETPYQSAPLDLGSDSFAIVRSQQIRARLDHIERTGGLDLIAEADDRERARNTWAVACRWELFSKQDLLEVAECLGGHSISVVCQMLVEEWDQCSGGMPDLVVWRMSDRVCRFVEVKGPGDRLSETQKVWIDVLLRAGVEVQVGLVRDKGKDGS